MIVELNVVKNKNVYQKTLNLNDDNVTLKSKSDFENFFFQNKERKNKSNEKELNDNFKRKRINKSITAFEEVIQKIGFDKTKTDGYLLDYSSYVSIFSYFENENDLLLYVQDICEARGDKIVSSINEAWSYLIADGVVISKVKQFYINSNEWDEFKKTYQKEK